MNTYRNLKLTTVRSVASSAIFVKNGVVQTTLPTHALRTVHVVMFLNGYIF
jgi:hypothetical protein